MLRLSFCLLAAAMVSTPVAANAQQPLLVGTSWGVAGETEKGGRFISFAGEGRLSGFAGCNRLRGRYEAQDGRLAITNIGTTRMACGGDAMAKEAAFLELLGRVRGARMDLTLLQLLDETGVALSTLEKRMP